MKKNEVKIGCCGFAVSQQRYFQSNLRKFFDRIDRQDLIFAWKRRDPWPEDVIRKICEDHQLIHCVDPFKNLPLAGSFQYFRLHGITGYRYAYTDEDLNILKARVQKKPTYFLFNNSRMVENALRFHELTGL